MANEQGIESKINGFFSDAKSQLLEVWMGSEPHPDNVKALIEEFVKRLRGVYETLTTEGYAQAWKEIKRARVDYTRLYEYSYFKGNPNKRTDFEWDGELPIETASFKMYALYVFNRIEKLPLPEKVGKLRPDLILDRDIRAMEEYVRRMKQEQQ